MQCFFVPQTDVGEWSDAFRSDIVGTVGWQTLMFHVDNGRNMIEAPAVYARGCGVILDTNIALYGAGHLELNTCDVPSTFRTYAKVLLTVGMAVSFSYAVISLIFWGMGMRPPGFVRSNDGDAA
jgi:hypothetical protein